MPKKPQSQDTLQVFVTIPASHRELLADLQPLPARARAERLRILAAIGLVKTASSPPSPTSPEPSDDSDAGDQRRKKMAKLRDRGLLA